MNYHCAKFCTNILTNTDTTILFPISRDFFPRNLEYFTHKIAIFSPIQLGIMANIVS